MNVAASKDFLKQLAKLKNPKLIQEVSTLYDQIELASSIRDIKNIKKLSGYDRYYRIRIGDYRLGFALEEDIVLLLAIAHRKDIYSIFP